MGQLDAPIAGALVGHVAFGEATVGKPVLRFQFVEQDFDVLRCAACSAQLGGQLGTAVLAAGQQTQRLIAQVCGG